MGLFGKRDTDDFDDYKREQVEMKREREEFDSSRFTEKTKKDSKAHNFAKNEKFNVEELPDGSLVYKKERVGKEKYLLGMFIAFPVLFMVIMVATGVVSGDISEITPAIVFFVIFFGIMFAAMASGKRCNSIRLTYDSIEVEVSSSKKFTFPLSSYEGLSFKRTYGKNHHYSGTIYHILIRDGAEVKKFKFCSTIPTAASDFNYNAKKRQQELTGATVGSANLPATKTFKWPDKLAGGNWVTNRTLLMLLCVVLIIVGTALGVALGGDLEDVIFPMIVIMFVIIAAVLMIVFGANSFVPTIYPESMTFEDGALRINDLSFSSNDIKAVYITPIGSDNPHTVRCSTFYIAMEDGQYRYRAAPLLFSSELDWSYDEFYYYFNNWCKKNGVPFVDYIL